MVRECVMMIERKNSAVPSCVPNHSVKNGNDWCMHMTACVCRTGDENNYQMKGTFGSFMPPLCNSANNLFFFPTKVFSLFLSLILMTLIGL